MTGPDRRAPFGRDQRLLRQNDFSQIFRHPHPVRVSAPGILLLAIRSAEPHPRLGLVVAKKVLRRAVWRNRVKRIARESFRLKGARLPAMDVVMIAKAPIATLSNQQLREHLDRLWAQASRRLHASASA